MIRAAGLLGRLRNRHAEPATASEDPAPCVPCGQKAGIRSFSLNDADLAGVSDELIPRLAPEIDSSVVGSDVVLFDPRRSTGTLLNATAALIWASIDDETCVRDLVDDLVEVTGADRATVDRDVRATVARFIGAGIVRSQPDDPVPEPDASPHHEQRVRRDGRIQAALERRNWSGAPQPRSCAGTSVLVRTDDPDLAEQLDAVTTDLAPAAHATSVISVTDRGHGARRYRILVDARTRGHVATGSEAIERVLAEIDDLAASTTEGRLVLHAGAVERDGDVIVIVGESGAGKSTLTASLVQRGHGYLTDEVVAIDPDSFEVTPYPKVVGLEPEALVLLGLPERSGPGAAKARFAPRELGHVSGGGRVALIVMLTPGSDPPGPITSAELLLQLLGHCFSSTFAPTTRGHEPLDALARLVETVPVLRLPRLPLATAHDTIESHLGR